MSAWTFGGILDANFMDDMKLIKRAITDKNASLARERAHKVDDLLPDNLIHNTHAKGIKYGKQT